MNISDGLGKSSTKCYVSLLADLGKARGCSTSTCVTNRLKSVNHSFPPTALCCRNAQTVRDSSSTYKIDYVIVMKKFLNLKRHQNCISGSKVTVILLKGFIWPIAGVETGRACACSLRSRLVFTYDSCTMGHCHSQCSGTVAQYSGTVAQ